MPCFRASAAALAAVTAAGACATFNARDDAAADAGAEGDGAPAPPPAGTDASADSLPGPATDAGGCASAEACPRIMFVSSEAYYPGSSLGSVAAADALCNQLAAASDANAAVKGRTYFAWLSDSTTSPATRTDVTHGTASYTRPDGVRLASSWKTLLGGALDATPNVDEKGGAGDYYVWTGTAPDGTTLDSLSTCASWTSSDPASKGFVGRSSQSDGAWTDYIGGETCAAPGHIYCVEK